MKTLLALLVLSPLFDVSVAHARWATLQDADVAIEAMDREIEVKADGTYTVTGSVLIEVLKEDGRRFSNYRRTYNARASKFEVLGAETINGLERVAVEPQFIEDKPMASSLAGFDDINVVTVAFPKVSIGSKLLFRYRERVSEVPVPEHFSLRVDFGDEIYMKSGAVTVRSETPLFVEEVDPSKQLEVSRQKEGGKHIVRARLTKPAYVRTVDEAKPAINPDDVPRVVFSNFKTFPQLAERLSTAYEAVLTSELPGAYAKIVKRAREKKSAVDQINFVTAELAEEVRYMGDWRPIRGGHVPRALELIAKTKFGDCKDFSASTVAMLRALGFKANVAWVERSTRPTPLPGIAYTGSFNHAIVRAEHEGRVFWVDPTNFASFAQGVFEDIIDRDALVVDAAGPRLDRIPNERPQDALRQVVSRTQIDGKGDASVKVKMRFTGRYAHWATGLQLKRSDEQIDYMLVTSLTDENRLKWSKIGKYNLKSRVVDEASFDVSYSEKNFSVRTTVGPAFYLDQRIVDGLLKLETAKRVSDLFLGAPRKLESTDFLENVRVVGTPPPGCTLETPWMRISRVLAQTPSGLKVTDVAEFKVSRIPIAELKTKAFRKFQEQLQQCFDRIAIVYEPVKKMVRQTSKPEAMSTAAVALRIPARTSSE